MVDKSGAVVRLGSYRHDSEKDDLFETKISKWSNLGILSSSVFHAGDKYAIKSENEATI